jgi:hypothetical protein
MMATTHALWGMTVALPVLAVEPELAPVALVAGLVGGVLPDLDLYAGHRKTLHFPVYGSLTAAAAIGVAAFAPSVLTVGIAVALAAAAVHAAADAAGGGLELRPWRGESDRAVYSHYHGRWLRPRRWVRYDGAPEDLGLAGVAAGLLAVTGGSTATAAATALLAVSVVYVLLRKPLATLAERLAQLLPGAVHPYVPSRYLECQ